MTRRRTLERHRRSLIEIREIMNSMKTLAYIEPRKLARFLEAQHAVVHGINAVAADLLSFYYETLPAAKEATLVYLLIGTERGFCGDFNHSLQRHLESALALYPTNNTMLIAVGHKLCLLMEKDARVVAFMDGASVVEEVPTLLHQLVNELATLQEKHGILNISCLYHSDENEIVMQELLPPFQHLRDGPPRFSHPPILNESPREFLVKLTDHYLFAALHEMLYTSLMVENHHRVAHLEGAVRHLDDESASLSQQCNALRQEEIIEEIEVNLLSTASLGMMPGKRNQTSIQDEIKDDD